MSQSSGSLPIHPLEFSGFSSVLLLGPKIAYVLSMTLTMISLLASATTLDSDDLCPETERSPVSAVKSVSGQAKRYEIDGIVVWARSWDLASAMVRE